MQALTVKQREALAKDVAKKEAKAEAQEEKAAKKLQVCLL